MFAGPNGSGKTTVKQSLRKPASWFGLYINPDDLERAVRETGFLALEPFELTASTDEVRSYFTSSEFLKSQKLAEAANAIVCRDNGIDFSGLSFNPYYASVLSDFLRRRALETGKTFSFETVMSARDKVELLREAQEKGFRTYLYYIATEDPAINVSRVKNRVAEGGHDVPEEKIIARYHRSLELLKQAVRYTNRAYFIDTSEDEAWYFAEVTGGTTITLQSDEIPGWFQPVWDQLAQD
jgi:predicted ABC-type ATPase